MVTLRIDVPTFRPSNESIGAGATKQSDYPFASFCALGAASIAVKLAKRPHALSWGVEWQSSGLFYPLALKCPRSVFVNRASFPSPESP